MVATAARQPGYRPETIRTRLARFMPRGAAAAWSVGWTSQSERAAEMSSEDELNVTEHLGCFAAAVNHALAKAEMAPRRLRLHADAKAAPEAFLQAITLEVHAAIAAEIDSALFESVVTRVEPACPVWRGLAGDGRLRVVPTAEPYSAEAPAAPAPTPAAAAPARSAGEAKTWSMTHQVRVPTWLTRRLAALLTVALGLLAVLPAYLSS